MNVKTKNGAIRKLRQYKAAGVVWQYPKTGRWGWATEGSGCYEDLVQHGRLNPRFRGGIDVTNIEWIN